MGDTSATGVAFTRNPSTGEKSLYGEFLLNAQGEDVVAGIRTPQEITETARVAAGSDKPSMERSLPDAFKELTRIYGVLEKHYRDMQDLEFTVEQGKLWMLQTRSGKRTAKAALRIAVELANEGLISRNDAVLRVDPLSLDQLLHPTIDPRAHRRVIATGLPASPGAASGGRHPDHPRRHDVPRRCGGARHGQTLRFGRGFNSRRLRYWHNVSGRPDVQKRRPHYRRRLDRTGAGRQGRHDRAAAIR